jgi:hypothetical protein
MVFKNRGAQVGRHSLPDLLRQPESAAGGEKQYNIMILIPYKNIPGHGTAHAYYYSSKCSGG